MTEPSQEWLDAQHEPSNPLYGLSWSAARLLDKDEDFKARANYLQSEINKMRRVMQDAGTWDQFCKDFADYERRHQP